MSARFFTVSTASTKKEKRSKKERKAAAATDSWIYFKPPLYTYKGGHRPGEGQPTRIAPQNVQTLAAAVAPDLPKVCDFPTILRLCFRSCAPELQERP